MKVGGPGINGVFLREVANTRAQMAEVQTQIASGKVASTYGGLGQDRSVSLALRQEMGSIAAYRDSIGLALPRVKIVQSAVQGMRDIASSTRSAMLVSGLDLNGSSQSMAQTQGRVQLGATLDLLNTEIGGRHLFSGTGIDRSPVAQVGEILDGADGKAGFRQVMDERRQADLGADGRGRLVLQTAGSSVQLAEDAAGSPFGFKMDAVSSTLTGTAVTGPAGSPAAIGVAFSASLPDAGDTIALTLAMPDGTSSEVRLKAVRTGEAGEGEFLVGADANATAANFRTALAASVEKLAGRELAAASMQAAANDFFTSGTAVPQRVDGPPFSSATALRDATDSDTVRWYRGEISDAPARETSLAKVDDRQIVAYGARADEAPFATLVKQLAVLSSATFAESDGDAYNKYAAMTGRVGSQLAYSVKADSLDRVVGDFAVAEGALSAADERHDGTDNMLTGYLAGIETTDVNQAGAKLLSLQTQLQASYQVTSMLSQLSLVNFL